MNAGGVLESRRGAWIQERCLDLYRRGAWIYERCLESVPVLGREGVQIFATVFFCMLVCRRPALKEVLVILEKLLSCLEEVLGSRRRAWI